MMSRLLVVILVVGMVQSANAMIETKCTSESLASEEFRSKLRTQFLWENIRAKGKRYPTEEDYLPLCLEGVRYTAIERFGSGREGVVYTIKNAAGEMFALKVYEPHQRG